MRELLHTVQAYTAIGDGYKAHAGVPSIEWHLEDWRAAHERLTNAIERLEALRVERLGQIERGEWPVPVPPPSAAENHVLDLMQALEESVANAKATRARVGANGAAEDAEKPDQYDGSPECPS